MQNTTKSIYYLRTENEDSIVIVWAPFSTYSSIVCLAIALIGVVCSVMPLSLIAFFLLVINMIAYSATCEIPRNEIKEATRTSSVQVSGNKFSISSPLTITISPKVKHEENIENGFNISKRGGLMRKVICGFFTAVFFIIGIFCLSTVFLGARQRATAGSILVLLVLALIFLLLAFLCFKAFKK